MVKNAENVLKRVIRERPLDSHKGDYGRLLLIGGTYPYGGAIIMAALAAVNSGAGLVTVATDCGRTADTNNGWRSHFSL